MRPEIDSRSISALARALRLTGFVVTAVALAWAVAHVGAQAVVQLGAPQNLYDSISVTDIADADLNQDGTADQTCHRRFRLVQQ